MLLFEAFWYFTPTASAPLSPWLLLPTPLHCTRALSCVPSRDFWQLSTWQGEKESAESPISASRGCVGLLAKRISRGTWEGAGTACWWHWKLQHCKCPSCPGGSREAAALPSHGTPWNAKVSLPFLSTLSQALWCYLLQPITLLILLPLSPLTRCTAHLANKQRGKLRQHWVAMGWACSREGSQSVL